MRIRRYLQTVTAPLRKFPYAASLSSAALLILITLEECGSQCQGILFPFAKLRPRMTARSGSLLCKNRCPFFFFVGFIFFSLFLVPG
ncbi:hypothetical protein BDV32DRAFT_129940 [Aspergillus pseudonomiae]|nr:hypothetical protein BDV32DRAFT_129940 [Aspergillus pseudonomiae]